MKKMTGILLGAILVACGVVYLLDTLAVIDINFSLNGWWTLFIILPCLNGLITSKNKLGNFAGLVFGILLLLAAQGVFAFDIVWDVIAPAIIILLGIKIISKNTLSKKETENHSATEKEYTSAFAEKNVDFADEEISVAKIGAVFGGTKCNLTNAKIHDGSRLNLLCLFGGADIFVPKNVNIKINTFCFFGGISDKREISETGPDNVTLNVNGFCVFGGANIK